MKGVLIFLVLMWGLAKAASLDGTSNIKYQSNHYIFRDQDLARGFVDLGKGFTVVPSANHGSNLYMDTNITFSGGIDLRGTSTLTLLRNLYLDEGVTFSDSGRVYSYGNALVMNGDLTIPADKVLHCGGNLIIDGNGYTLHMASGSQLFLDNSSTLTLCNVIVETTHSFPGQPALNISSSMSKLALDNVLLSLGDDFYVNHGQLFFHNDVVVTGTSALVYRSIAPSYVAAHGCLMFDHGSTFSYAPATDNKDLIVLSDASSTLVFNESSLLATHTGLRLTKGRLYFDDKVNVNSLANNRLNSLSLITDCTKEYGNTVYATAWSPNGKYMAIGGYNPTNPSGGFSDTNELRLYSFNGTAFTAVTSQDYTPGGGYIAICALDWSPDGRFLAFGGYGNDNQLQIYQFNGSTLSSVVSQSFGLSNYIQAIRWSPDGQYIAVGGSNGSTDLTIYRFDGKVLTSVATQPYGDYISAVAWSCDGQYIAIGGWDNGNTELRMYRFNGNSLTLTDLKDYGTSVSSVISTIVWSPDSQYVAIGGGAPEKFDDVANPNELQIYRCTSGTLAGVISIDYGTVIYSLVWSPDGRYIAAGGIGPTNNATTTGFANNNELRIYRFDGHWLFPVTSQDYSNKTVSSLSWSPCGKYLALGGDYGSNNIQVLLCLFANDTSTQPMDRSIIFGNSAAGSTYNLDAHVLAGARVEINGNVVDDPA